MFVGDGVGMNVDDVDGVTTFLLVVMMCLLETAMT